MITILFWNIYRKDLSLSISRIAKQHQIDLILLAESGVEPSQMLWSLNSKHDTNYHFAASPGCTKIQTFTRFVANEYAPIIVEDSRMTIRELRLPSMTMGILIAALHFPSKMNYDESDQIAESPRYSDLIRQSESLVGHERTVLVGDMNMNPFERGMVNASGLNSVATQEIARLRSRTHQERSYPFFYNPMWSRLGDGTTGPPGTHYHGPSGHGSYYWHTYDQVLLRPDLLDYYNHKGLEILTADGVESLVKPNGRPDDARMSDHLPIILRLDL